MTKMTKDNRIKNVILITIDSLRADHLSCLGYHRKTTPRMDELAKKGVLFSQAISNAPGTPSSFPPILTSTYPLMYGGYEYLSKERTTIASVLKDNGFTTAAFHSNPYLSRKFGYNRGFDIFEDFMTEAQLNEGFLTKIKKRVKNAVNEKSILYRYLFSLQGLVKKELKPIIRAEELNQKAIDFVQGQKNKFFLWIHYMDVHYPYVPPKNYLKKFSEISSRKVILKLNEKVRNNDQVSKDGLQKIIDLYDGEIAYIDHALGSFLDELESKGLLSNTLIVITSDHGDEFYEHGGFLHGQKLYDELIHVPLIMHAPEVISKGTVVKEQIALLDTAPTIIDILGIDKNENFQGASSFPVIIGEKKSTSEYVISEESTKKNSVKIDLGRREISCRTKEWKYISYAYKPDEFYNLIKDPRETQNLLEREEEKAKYFKSIILDHISMIADKNRKIVEKRTREQIKLLKKRKKIG